jgi:hypothetical protein
VRSTAIVRCTGAADGGANSGSVKDIWAVNARIRAALTQVGHSAHRSLVRELSGLGTLGGNILASAIFFETLLPLIVSIYLAVSYARSRSIKQVVHPRGGNRRYLRKVHTCWGTMGELDPPLVGGGLGSHTQGCNDFRPRTNFHCRYNGLRCRADGIDRSSGHSALPESEGCRCML